MTLTSDLSSAPDSLERLRDSFDFLIIVSAGPAAGEAARRLAGRLDSSLLVIAAERTPAAQAHELFDNITSQGGQPLGVVMTGCRNLSSTW
jgi:Mrp family chromosome partitioning ATPase